MTTHDDKESLVNNYGNEKLSLNTEYQENKLPARLLRVNEVARFLGVQSSTVRRWEKKGLLRSYSIGLGRNLRFKQEDVLNFLDECQGEGAHGLSLEQNASQNGKRLGLLLRQSNERSGL